MAAEIKRRYGVDSALIQGKGGVYDVRVDSTLVFSKHDTGRFPEDREIFDALDALKKPAR